VELCFVSTDEFIHELIIYNYLLHGHKCTKNTQTQRREEKKITAKVQ